MARAIDAEGLEKEMLYGDVNDGETFEEYIGRVIRQAPTIEPKQEWISVKDRLPEMGQEVLVFWDDGIDTGRYVGGKVGDDVYWMPLPDAPEERVDEND